MCARVIVPGPNECEREGRELLGLSDYYENDGTNGKLSAEYMFYAGDWPEPFRNRYRRARLDHNRKRMAKVTADRLEHYITTGK